MFFSDLKKYDTHIALIHQNEQLTYGQLQIKINQALDYFLAPKQLVFLLADNSIESIVFYLAALQSNHCLVLLPHDLTSNALQNLIEQYQPNVLIKDNQFTQLSSAPLNIDQKVVLLLSTSGSTGSPKQVALSANNLNANACSICDYLPIISDDKTLLTLPMFYSYGLSVINSHLLKGACIVLTEHAVTTREFWQLFKQLNITSFAGVPHLYEMLIRLGFTQMELPSLRYFTQAGGKLKEAAIIKLTKFAQQSNAQLFVMYGQTEATARMAYLSPLKNQTKPTSVGQVIPGGEFEVRDIDNNKIVKSKVTGELFYRGQNVMLGYTTNLLGLAELPSQEWLATGDLAYFDEEGDFFIVGRLKRFIKINGFRVDLDEVESLLKRIAITALCCGIDQKLVIATTSADEHKIRDYLSEQLMLHPRMIKLITVDELPINANGKNDYSKISKLAGLTCEQ